MRPFSLFSALQRKTPRPKEGNTGQTTGQTQPVNDRVRIRIRVFRLQTTALYTTYPSKNVNGAAVMLQALGLWLCGNYVELAPVSTFPNTEHLSLTLRLFKMIPFSLLINALNL